MQRTDWNGLSADEKDSFVSSLVEYGTDFVAPLYSVVEKIEETLQQKNSTIRAQADARPVAWCRRETVKKWPGQLVNAAYMFPSPEGIKDAIPLYTHPEASAPGLSDEDTLSVAAALESARVFIKNGVELGYIRMPDADCPDPAHGTLPLIERAMRILTRASAATTMPSSVRKALQYALSELGKPPFGGVVDCTPIMQALIDTGGIDMNASSKVAADEGWDFEYYPGMFRRGCGCDPSDPPCDHRAHHTETLAATAHGESHE